MFWQLVNCRLRDRRITYQRATLSRERQLLSLSRTKDTLKQILLPDVLGSTSTVKRQQQRSS